MSTRWRDMRDGAKIIDRPSRTGQGFQKARLGVAAEHPDRAGLPRRHITEYHTEVRVSDYDPINLGSYAPFDVFTINEVARHCVLHIVAGYTISWSYCLSSEIYSDQERKEIMDLIEWYCGIDRIISKNTWVMLREALVDDVAVLFAIGKDGVKKGIHSHFWATSSALNVLSTGVMEIPMYEPSGIVYANRDELNKLRVHFMNLSHSSENYFDTEYFKFNTTQSVKEKIIRGRENQNIEMMPMESVPRAEIIRSVRGRKPTFDVSTLWGILMEIKTEGNIDISKRGSKKAIIRIARERYKEKKGSDELPGDDAVSERISVLWRMEEDPKKLLLVDHSE